MEDYSFPSYIPPDTVEAILGWETRGIPIKEKATATSPKGAYGPAQIMKHGALADWNQNHPKDDQYSMDDMSDIQKASRVANWYINVKIPEYIHNYGLDPSLAVALAMYNWGPTNVGKKGLDKAPKETLNYIKGVTALIEQYQKNRLVGGY